MDRGKKKRKFHILAMESLFSLCINKVAHCFLVNVRFLFQLPYQNVEELFAALGCALSGHIS